MLSPKTGDDSKVRRLIEDGADVNLTDGDNKLPIHWAALRGFDKVVSLLLEKGGSEGQVHKHDSFGETPLHLAMYGGLLNDFGLHPIVNIFFLKPIFAGNVLLCHFNTTKFYIIQRI